MDFYTVSFDVYVKNIYKLGRLTLKVSEEQANRSLSQLAEAIANATCRRLDIDQPFLMKRFIWKPVEDRALTDYEKALFDGWEDVLVIEG